MIRALHRWPGLLALALVTVLALSGAALSVFPAVERLAAPQAEAGMSVADLATRIQAAYPGVEQIRRAPSGRITAYWFDRRRARRRRHRPRDRCRAWPPPTRIRSRRWLTNSAPLAVSGRCRPHRHGGGGGGDAGAVALRRGAGRAARRRLAALVRAPARAAPRSASCRDRSHRGAWPYPVVRHRALDDGLDLRTCSPTAAPTLAIPAEVSGETGVALGRDGDAGRHARRGAARAELSLSR